MTREELKKLALSLKFPNVALQLPTGYGKSRIALEILNSKYPEGNILIVAPKLVLFKTWQTEIDKWFPNNKWNITFTTYISFPKYKERMWSGVIFDECHHITERVIIAFNKNNYKSTLYLSATIKKDQFNWLKLIHRNKIDFIKLSLRDAIIDDVLPEPTVYCIPLNLDIETEDQVYIRNKHNKNIIECEYKDRNKYWRRPKTQLHVKCTQKQYIEMIDNEISFYKTAFMNNGLLYQKNIWLRLAGERLKYLSNLKIDVIKSILNKLANKRTITFCADINQSEILGKYSINSKKKKSSETLSKFNDEEINHITCCNMLNEGVNLYNCQIGIWAIYNSSTIMIVQKVGRLLRHMDPIIILPYYRGTREEEIVNKMLENFNSDNIKTINNLDELCN